MQGKAIVEKKEINSAFPAFRAASWQYYMNQAAPLNSLSLI